MVLLYCVVLGWRILSKLVVYWFRLVIKKGWSKWIWNVLFYGIWIVGGVMIWGLFKKFRIEFIIWLWYNCFCFVEVNLKLIFWFIWLRVVCRSSRFWVWGCVGKLFFKIFKVFMKFLSIIVFLMFCCSFFSFFICKLFCLLILEEFLVLF